MSNDFYPDDWSPKLGQEKSIPIERITKRISRASGKPGIDCFRGTLFGNPFTSIRGKKTKAEFIVDSLDECLDKHNIYFINRVETDEIFRKAVLNLRGESLICYCRESARCHVDNIIEWIENN